MATNSATNVYNKVADTGDRLKALATPRPGTPPVPPPQSKLVDLPQTQGGGGSINYAGIGDAKDRGLISGAALAAKYGNINYDQNAIEGVFQGAVDAQYAAKQKGYDRTANQYYNRLGASQNAYLDAMRKANAGAVQSGAATGMQSANAVSGMLGMSQQTSMDATKLTQDARAIVDQQTAAKALATQQAMQYADQQKQALMGAGVNLYSADTQKYVGELGANAQLGAANVAASAQGYSANKNLEGSRYNAEQNLQGQRYVADQNLNGQRYTSDRNLQGQQYSADKSLAGQQVYATGMVQSANANAGATKYAANQNVKAAGITGMSQIEATQQQQRGEIVQTFMSNGDKPSAEQVAQYIKVLYPNMK